MSLEPIPETVRAIKALLEWGDDSDLLAGLQRLADRALGAVPELIGVSITRLSEGITFTLVASSEQVAALDALQYLGGGPCVEGASDQRIRVSETQDILDEQRWRLFGLGTAAAGVRSTLTLPIHLQDGGYGSVNLYAASAHAFDEKARELAGIFGALAQASVVNADLSFLTRRQARRAPRVIRDLTLVNTAAGVLAARTDVGIDEALQRLENAAGLAGVTTAQLAELIINTAGPGEDSAGPDPPA